MCISWNLWGKVSLNEKLTHPFFPFAFLSSDVAHWCGQCTQSLRFWNIFLFLVQEVQHKLLVLLLVSVNLAWLHCRRTCASVKTAFQVTFHEISLSTPTSKCCPATSLTQSLCTEQRSAEIVAMHFRMFPDCPSCRGELALKSLFFVAYAVAMSMLAWIVSLCLCMTLFLADCPSTRLALQCEKATPRGEDCQHLPEGPADETETERFGEETRKLALLEAHSAQHWRRGGCGCRPACVLDILPMIHCGSLGKRLLFCTSSWRKVLL